MSKEENPCLYGIFKSCKGVFGAEIVAELCSDTRFLENLAESIFTLSFAVLDMTLGKADMPAFCFTA